MNTPSELADMLAEYRTGLEGELRLLAQLRQLSSDQHEAGHASEMARLGAINTERDRVMNALMAIEETLKPLRHTLATRRKAIATLPGYADTIALHRKAEALVREIVDGDRRTVAALEKVEGTRRLAHEMMTRDGRRSAPIVAWCSQNRSRRHCSAAEADRRYSAVEADRHYSAAEADRRYSAAEADCPSRRGGPSGDPRNGSRSPAEQEL